MTNMIYTYIVCPLLYPSSNDRLSVINANCMLHITSEARKLVKLAMKTLLQIKFMAGT